MNIIITSGGTSEKIDSVRKITNSSSGKLGSIIANMFLKKFKIDNLFYICSKKSILPKKNKKIKIINITDTQSLKDNIENILNNYQIDIFIHSMAVSDYTVDKVVDFSELEKNINSSNNLIEILNKSKTINNNEKISSNINPILFLKQTPKIISLIKKWSPKTFLVGFKLLNNVSEDTLINTAYNLLQSNNCDLVVANDLVNINKKQHYAYIIDKNKNNIFAKTKIDIAKQLVRKIKNDKL